MIVPDYRLFRRAMLQHSAKGSTWDDHKYIKRIDGTYYYPDSYKGGRHLPDGDKSKSESDDEKESEKDDNKTAVDRWKEDEEKRFAKLETWEKELYPELDKWMQQNPDRDFYKTFGDPEEENFSVILMEFIGMDPEEEGLSEDQVEAMRSKMVKYYKERQERMQKAVEEDDMANLEKVEQEAESRDSSSLNREGIAAWRKDMADPGTGENEKIELTEADVENLANEVIQGKFGNGQTRKDLLGDNYQQVQDRVNQLMKSSTGEKRISQVSKEEVSEGEKKIQNVVEKVTQASKGLNLEEVYQVYRKRTK